MIETITGARRERFLFLDIMRVIALILMPCIHIFGMVTTAELVGELFPTASVSTQMGLIYLIVPGVFMFCMGAGIALSRKNTPKELCARGLRLLLTGLILNAVRGSVFLWFGLLIDSVYYMEFWYWLWGSDILFFAGLYFLLFALFRRLKLRDGVIAAITVCMLALSHIIMPVPVGNETMVQLLGNLVYVNYDSCFPLLSWSVFPTVGYLFMKHYPTGGNTSRYVLRVFAAAALVLALTVGALLLTGKMLPRYYLWGEEGFMMDIPSALIAVSAAVVYAAAVYGIASLIPGGRFTALMEKLSAAVNTIYLIHWVLVNYLMLFWVILSDHLVQEPPEVYLIGVSIFVLSVFPALAYRRRQQKKREPAAQRA